MTEHAAHYPDGGEKAGNLHRPVGGTKSKGATEGAHIVKIVSAAEYKAKGFRKLQEEAAQPAAPDVVIPDDMARASLALMSRVFTPTEELIEYRQKRLDAMLAGDLTDDARTSLGYAAEQLERARHLHARGAADVDIATVLEVIDLRLKDVVVVAAANKTTTKFKSEAGKHAVSYRKDQQLEQPWKDHVKACMDRGDVIRNINDLLEIKGYPPGCARVTPKTLKRWAREAVPGLKFKAGRTK